MKNTTINHYVNVVIAAALLATLTLGAFKPGALPIALLIVVVVVWASLQISSNAVESVKALLKKED